MSSAPSTTRRGRGRGTDDETYRPGPDGTLLEVKVSDDLVEPLSEFRVVTPVPTDDSTPDSATL